MLKQMLVIDDDVLICKGLASLFSKNYHVVEARSPTDMRACLKTQAFDIAISDIELGTAETGLDLIADLKAAHIPVIMCSARADDATIALACTLGASGFSSKFADPAQLIQAVQTVVAGGEHFPAWLTAEERARRKQRMVKITPESPESPKNPKRFWDFLRFWRL